ncbi:ATP-binding cassette domain-containing protein [Bacillus mangrovi]|uniref:ATP-binding cassette domain-containing protein n=1 Tax=Metabacillus mangrovi TaxID=1491830 RepID=A0A7X2S9L6_9BACI|nr:ABC transporter ATP-binding protein [Metabacillus mangrovi]MTH55191.1 ATP-binding cassette domain-containing protein [Metabacillus mangrovi]
MSKIELINVSKKIKGKRLLNDISLTIDKGKICGFVGSNGSGKSMLFRAIAGLIKPSSGNVRIFGKELHKDLSFPESIGVIFEKPGFLDQYNAFDNLKFLSDIQGKIDSEQIKRSIRRVGLDPEDKRPVKTYSLGMKQKLSIAQAIMEKPELILLDEPMNGLDEQSVIMIYEVIKQEKNRGATVLITSHHRTDIETLCEEVYKIHEGTVKPFHFPSVLKTQQVKV